MDHPSRCAYCGGIIGVYEPVRVIVADGTELKGSSLMLGDSSGRSGASRCTRAATTRSSTAASTVAPKRKAERGRATLPPQRPAALSRRELVPYRRRARVGRLVGESAEDRVRVRQRGGQNLLGDRQQLGHAERLAVAVGDVLHDRRRPVAAGLGEDRGVEVRVAPSSARNPTSLSLSLSLSSSSGLGGDVRPG